MKMKKFINDPENLTPELLEGFAEAHKDLVRLGDERMVINRKLDEADRVIFGPLELGPGVRLAFVIWDDASVELYEEE